MTAKLNPTPPMIAPTFIMRLAPLGIRTVVKKGAKTYRYRYLRLDVGIFPEVVGTRLIRVLVAPTDFSAPPVLITARLAKRGRRTWGYVIDAQYQRIVESYARSGYVAVLFVEAMEHEKDDETPRQPQPALAPVPRTNLVVKNLTAEQIQRILSGGDAPVEVGGVRCLKLAFSRCSPALQAEKAAAALASAPPEVKAAGRAEIMAMLRAATSAAGSEAISRLISRLGLPDEQAAYGEEHIQQARELIAQALAECAICVADAVEIFEKFVETVHATTDRRGRHAYQLIIRAGGDEIQVLLRPSDFRGRGRSKNLKVPEVLNNIMRDRLGIEIDQKSAGDLLTLIELHSNTRPTQSYIISTKRTEI